MCCVPARYQQRNAVAVAYCKQGSGILKINGSPIELVEPEPLRIKVFEPIALLGKARFEGVDIRIRVKGGGYTAQIYGALGSLRAHGCAPRLAGVVGRAGSCRRGAAWCREPQLTTGPALLLPTIALPQPSARHLPRPWLRTPRSVRSSCW